MTTVAQELYDKGYQITGEGRRIDIIDTKKEKYLEIFFFPNEVLVMSQYDYIWADSISNINIMHKGVLPQVELVVAALGGLC